MNKTQTNLIMVLDRIREQAIADTHDAEVYAFSLEGVLNNLKNEDFFGTEGQNDPRGDFRNGQWTMKKVEHAAK